MRMNVHDLIGEDIAAGAATGVFLQAKLLEEIESGEWRSEVIFLDFIGIKHATASFLREAVLGLRQSVRRRAPQLQVVIANASPTVLEELRFVLAAASDAAVVCELGRGDEVRKPRLLGTLEEAQRQTLRAVLALGEADAGALRAMFKDESIGPTAWNNRLSALVDRGVLLEIRHGRSKTFRPVVEGLTYGS